MKRILSFLAVLAMIIAVLPASAFAEILAEEIVITNDGPIKAFVGDQISINVSVLPEGAKWNYVTASSSNNDVVTVSLDGIATINSPGTATVTVTSDSGLTDSIEVIARDATELRLDEAFTVDSDTNGVGRFTFTPEETGDYALICFDSDYDAYCELYDSNNVMIAENDDYMWHANFRLESELVAGETYTFQTYPHNSDDGSDPEQQYSVKLVKLSPLTGITFGEDNVEIYTGMVILLQVYSVPEYTPTEPYIYSCSSYDAVNFTYLLECIALQPGTAVITASTDSGFYTSVTVTVSDPKEVALGEENGMSFNSLTKVHYYTFTPSESKDYYVYINKPDEYGISVSETESGTETAVLSQSGFVSLEAGVEYTFKVESKNEAVRGNEYSFTVAEDAINEPVKGDVNNDGKLTASDYLMLKKLVFSRITLDDLKEPETALERCDLNGDGKVTATDYLKLKRMIFTM